MFKKLTVFALYLGLVACGPSFTFFKRAQPSPLKGATKITVLPLSLEGMQIGGKSEDQYLADKREKDEAKGKEGKADDRESNWEADKNRWVADFSSLTAQQLSDAGVPIAAADAASEGFVVKTVVEFIEPGFYAVMAARPSETRVRVQVFDAAKPDEVVYEFTGKASNGGFTTGDRVGKDVQQLAKQVGSFLADEYKGG